MVSLIQGVKSDITAKIERGLIVLVLSEESQTLGQSKPHSAQDIEPWTAIGASRKSGPEIRAQKIPNPTPAYG